MLLRSGNKHTRNNNNIHARKSRYLAFLMDYRKILYYLHSSIYIITFACVAYMQHTFYVLCIQLIS